VAQANRGSPGGAGGIWGQVREWRGGRR